MRLKIYNSLGSTITEQYQISNCIILLGYNYVFITGTFEVKDINITRNGTDMCLTCVYQQSSNTGCIVLVISPVSSTRTINITWNAEEINSGIFSQSNNNGDHKYRCYEKVDHNVIRNRYLTVTGKY